MSVAETKSVSITKEGYQDYHRSDECPGSDLVYLLRRY